MNWLAILKDKRFSWILVVLLAVFSAYKLFSPKEIKLVKTEHMVYDRTTETKLRSQVNELKQKVKSFSKQINEDETATETYDPVTGKLITRVIQKKKTTNTSGNSTEVTVSSSTTNVDGSSHEHGTVDKKTEQTTNAMPFWTTSIGYLYFNKQVVLGQGINLGRGWSGMVLGSWSFKEGLTEKDRWDIGGQAQFRY